MKALTVTKFFACDLEMVSGSSSSLLHAQELQSFYHLLRMNHRRLFPTHQVSITDLLLHSTEMSDSALNATSRHADHSHW
jgi:hypothetical protein